MPLDTTESFGPTLLATGGFLKTATIAGIPVLIDSVTYKSSNNYQYTRFALTPPTGYKQKTPHSRGTCENSFQISGDLSAESAGLANFLKPVSRGQPFTVTSQQGSTKEYLPQCYLETFSLQGGANSIVKYNISGKSLIPVTTQPSSPALIRHHPIPGWSTGNALVKNWSITHTIPLSPSWANDQNPYPAYYRPQESEYNLTITTALALCQYDTIYLGIGALTIVQALITERSVISQGKDAKTYSVSLTNVNIVTQATASNPARFGNAFTPGVTVLISGSPESSPDGL